MRTMTTQQDTILASPHRSNHVRVKIDRGSSDWVDMTDLEGRDWVHSVEYGGEIDNSVIEASVQLIRKVDGFSLSTLMDDSKLNADGVIVDIGNPIVIDVAVIADGYQPTSADWVEVFRGEIDSIDWSRSPIKLQCRDQGGQLEAFIETQAKRPADPSTSADVEDIMQEILDGVFSGSVVLYSPNGTGGTPFQPGDSPGWTISEYIQRKQAVFQALRVLSDQIGWSLRYLWHSNTSAFQLQLYQPDREASARGIMLLDGQPLNNETFVVNATTFTAKTSGAGADEFNIGTALYETGANIAAMLNSGSESSNIKAWYDPTNNTAKVMVEWIDRGTAGNSKVFTTSMTNTYVDGGGTLGGAIRGVGVTTGRSARGTMTLAGQPSATETFVVNATTCTAVAGAPAADQFQIGGTVIATCVNIANMLNAGSESANLKAWFSSPESGVYTVVIEWSTPGTAGNSIVFTESLSNTTIDGGGTLGGTKLGTDFAGARTFGSDQYFSIDRLAISRANIRNVIRVKYGVLEEDRTTVEQSDSASITKYGRRFMEIAEAATSQIDSISEAQTLANSILDDLKEPDMDKSVTLPFFWPVEFGDYYTFEANGVHYDSDQTLAVIAYRHSLTREKCRTTLQCRGKPAGGLKRWFLIEARPGVGGENDFFSNEAASGMAVEASVGTLIITYDDPRGMSPPINDWAFSKCHVDTNSGFTPSDSTLVAFGRQTRFEVSGLVPGTTYYSKVQIIDSSGNVAATSSQVTTAAQYVGPYHANPDREYGVILMNQDFGAQTLPVADNPPDYWSARPGTNTFWGSGGSDNVYISTSVHLTGGRSLYFPADSFAYTREMISDFFPVQEDGLYMIRTTVKASGSPSTGTTNCYIAILLYDSTKSYIGATATEAWDHDDVGSNWVVISDKALEPNANARYGRALLGITEEDVNWYVDSVSVIRFQPGFAAGLTSGQTIANGSPTSGWVTVQFDSDSGGVQYDYGSYFDTANYRFDAPTDGFYSFMLDAEESGLASGKWFRAAFAVNGTRVVVSNAVVYAMSGNHLQFGSGPIELYAGDQVTVEVEHDNASSITITTDTIFRGQRISEKD